MNNNFNILENNDECRICLQEDNINKMISPCLCRGSNKYVHRECLNQWIRLSDNPNNIDNCPTCKFKYHIETIDNCKCFSSFSNCITTKFLNLICFNILAMIGISIILFELNGQEEILYNNFNIYNVSLLIIVIVFLLFFIISYIKIKNKKLVNKYYLKYKMPFQLFALLLGCLMLFVFPLFGFFIISLFLNTIMRIHMIVIDSVNLIGNDNIVSLSDAEINQLRV